MKNLFFLVTLSFSIAFSLGIVVEKHGISAIAVCLPSASHGGI